eukprot:TRINITY_DN6788_c0_g1_i8.p2 TRINITY_DN6788_c0_g1~~TRINITY_DN6788_c0_g1_i8.p2  ORF type:complete len:137 (-),score=26.53 TRINITY_DN6788_c0_g1_i8:34-444(-)
MLSKAVNRVSVDQSPKSFELNKKLKTRNSSFVKTRKPSNASEFNLNQSSINPGYIQSLPKNKDKLVDLLNNKVQAGVKSRLQYKSSSISLKDSIRMLNKMKHVRNESMIYNLNAKDKDVFIAVSYTHLTLPTICSV